MEIRLRAKIKRIPKRKRQRARAHQEKSKRLRARLRRLEGRKWAYWHCSFNRPDEPWTGDLVWEPVPGDDCEYTFTYIHCHVSHDMP